MIDRPFDRTRLRQLSVGRFARRSVVFPYRSWFVLLLSLTLVGHALGDNTGRIDEDSEAPLTVPPLVEGPPEAGKRVAITPPEYAGTEVFHTIYLPSDWRPDGEPTPIIFEYTGNYFPASGSTGEPEDAALGYGLTAGRYIWVSLPYVSKDHTDNATTWWGDVEATVNYAKVNVPRIIEAFGGDSDAIFLCGFSRGAIGVNFIGLHDDEIAKCWTGFISHDHFDGVRSWGNTDWGSPLDRYRRDATQRLKRVAGRPYLVSQNSRGYGTKEFVEGTLSDASNFRYLYVDVGAALGRLPNELARTNHTDRWPLRPSPARQKAWQWMNHVASAMKNPSTDDR